MVIFIVEYVLLGLACVWRKQNASGKVMCDLKKKIEKSKAKCKPLQSWFEAYVSVCEPRNIKSIFFVSFFIAALLMRVPAHYKIHTRRASDRVCIVCS